jgi:type I restriction enzyme S subunit
MTLELMNQTLPKGWNWIKLGDVCKTTSGGTPSRGNKSYYQGNIPWVKSGELDRGLITDTEEKITQDAIKGSSAKIFPPGTLLIALYGATIGKLAFLGVEAATNQAICGIYQSDLIQSKYLFNYLIHKKQDLVNQGIGGAQPNISQTILKNLPVPLPPLPSQVAIVSKIEELFSELDKGIENLKIAQEQLKVYRQSVLKWAFEGKFTNENVRDGEMPNGWELILIGDATISLDNKRKPINREERLKRQGDIPYYGANGRVGWINDYIFNEDLVCVVEDETFTGREIPFSYKISGKSWVNNHAHVLKPKENLNIDFLNYQLAYYPFLRLTTGTTGRKKLTKNALSSAPIKICSGKEQQKVVEEIEARLSVADKMEETINHSLLQAESLRQSVLKRAFEGKLI